jgi:hypothetical protein
LLVAVRIRKEQAKIKGERTGKEISASDGLQHKKHDKDNAVVKRIAEDEPAGDNENEAVWASSWQG